MYKDRYFDACQELNYCIITRILSKKNWQSNRCYASLISWTNVLNTSNQHGKSREITFNIVQGARVIIGASNVLRAGFTSDLGDEGREDEKKSGSAKILKTNIKPALKNKEKGKRGKRTLKGKRGKHTLGQTKKPLIKKIAKYQNTVAQAGKAMDNVPPSP